MTLEQAEAQAVDLAALTPAQVAVAHPFLMARMTKIVKPVEREDAETEILEGRPVPFVLWPHQREIVAAALAKRRVIVLKARQLGVTWVMALFALWYACAHPHVEVVIVSIGDREARKVGRRIQWLYNHLPLQVRAAFPAPNPTLEAFRIRHTGGDSTITSLPSSSTAGRGETVNLLLLDEGAHWEDASTRLAALLPTVEDIGQLIFASTANGLGDPFQETWDEAPANGYHPIFAAADARPDRTEKGIEQMRARVPDGKGPQEYPMTPAEAFLSSGKCAFNTRALQSFKDRIVRPPKRRGWIDLEVERTENPRDPDKIVERRTLRWREDQMNGWWRVWRWRAEGRRYLIAGDPCGGGGGVDYAAMAVYDIDSWEQVASFHGRPEPEEFAVQMVRAGWFWRGRDGEPALLAPESNLDGRAVVAYLREWAYPNVWVQPTYDQQRDDRTVQIGWATSTRTRPIMLSALKSAITEYTLAIRDVSAIGEMLTFEVNPKTGKEQAREGRNDDRVMCHAIAAAVLTMGASGAMTPSTTPQDLLPYRQVSNARTGY